MRPLAFLIQPTACFAVLFSAQACTPRPLPFSNLEHRIKDTNINVQFETVVVDLASIPEVIRGTGIVLIAQGLTFNQQLTFASEERMQKLPDADGVGTTGCLPGFRCSARAEKRAISSA